MGSLNPETLYQKVYSDSSLKKDGIIDEVSTKDFREFLKRTKPNFNIDDGSDDNELLESLSILVNNNYDIGKEIFRDKPDNFCNSVCNKIQTSSLLTPKVIIVSAMVSLSSLLIYKMRKNSIRNSKEGNHNNKITNNNKSTNNKITNNNKMHINEHSDSDNDTEIVSESNNPRIVFIKKSWFW